MVVVKGEWKGREETQMGKTRQLHLAFFKQSLSIIINFFFPIGTPPWSKGRFLPGGIQRLFLKFNFKNTKVSRPLLCPNPGSLAFYVLLPQLCTEAAASPLPPSAPNPLPPPHFPQPISLSKTLAPRLEMWPRLSRRHILVTKDEHMTPPEPMRCLGLRHVLCFAGSWGLQLLLPILCRGGRWLHHMDHGLRCESSHLQTYAYLSGCFFYRSQYVPFLLKSIWISFSVTCNQERTNDTSLIRFFVYRMGEVCWNIISICGL